MDISWLKRLTTDGQRRNEEERQWQTSSAENEDRQRAAAYAQRMDAIADDIIAKAPELIKRSAQSGSNHVSIHFASVSEILAPHECFDYWVELHGVRDPRPGLVDRIHRQDHYTGRKKVYEFENQIESWLQQTEGLYVAYLADNALLPHVKKVFDWCMREGLRPKLSLGHQIVKRGLGKTLSAPQYGNVEAWW